MNIETVKDFGSNYLVNDSLNIPKDSNNSHYELVLKWIDQGGIVEPRFTDEELLANAIENKKRELKVIVQEFIYKPIDYLNTKFVNSEISGNNLQAAYAFIEEPIEWLDLYGNSVTLTKAEVKKLIGLILQQRSKGYFLKAQYEKEIDECLTIEELEDLVFNFE